MTEAERRSFLLDGTRTAMRAEIATEAIGRGYAGDDGAEEFARYADQQLKLLIRVRPTRIIARDSVGEG